MMKISNKQRYFLLGFLGQNCKTKNRVKNRVKGQRALYINIDYDFVLQEDYNVFIDADYEKALNLLTDKFINIVLKA